MINWEEFGRSQLARTVLNLSQLGRREASDLAFHRKAVARKMTGPHSHRGGHWFDPSIAHPAQRPVPIMELASLDLAAAANGSNGHASQSLSLRSASRVASEGVSVCISIVTAILLCRRMRLDR